MSTKIKNLRQQLRRELHRQFKAGKGQSRHADKQAAGGKPIYDKIYSNLSLKTHLSRIEQFSGWIKENHSDIKNLNEITRETVGEYLKHQVTDGKSPYTISADMLAINRVQMAQGHWQEPIKKSEYNLPQRAYSANAELPSTRPFQ